MTLAGGKATCATSALESGTHSITASYSGDANNTETTSRPLRQVVNKAGQTIAFCPPPAMIFGETKDGCATGGASGKPVIFSSPPAGVCSLTPQVCSGSDDTLSCFKVTGIKAGTCTIAANQSDNDNYKPARQATQKFKVGKANQTITFGPAPTVNVGGSGTVSATGGDSGRPVTFSSLAKRVCTIKGNTVTGKKVGACTIAANQAGNTNYNAARDKQTFPIGQGN